MLPLEEFERLLISSDADRELIAILANTCQAAMSKDHNIDVINRITQKALSKVGYVPRVILLRTVLKEFWKGE